MKYAVPVSMTISGHILVEIPGKDSIALRKRAIALAKEKYTGYESIELPCSDTDWTDDPREVEIDE